MVVGWLWLGGSLLSTLRFYPEIEFRSTSKTLQKRALNLRGRTWDSLDTKRAKKEERIYPYAGTACRLHSRLSAASWLRFTKLAVALLGAIDVRIGPLAFAT